MRAVVDGGEVIAPLADRILGRSAAVDILDPLSGKVLIEAGELIEEEAVDRIEQAGLDSVSIRSVLTCESRVGVCGKCYGRDLARGTVVNIGEAVGVIAAQSIGEPGTQLTMRTFHIGGAVQRGAEVSAVEAAFDAKVEIRNRNVVKNSSNVLIVMGRNLEVVLLDDGGREKARHRVPYGAKLLVDDKAQVTKGQKLAEWDPYTIPIISERDGIAHYVDLTEGVSVREVVDEATGISSKVVIDWKQQPRGNDLKPRIVLRDAKGNALVLPNGVEARSFLSVDAILSVENQAQVRAGDVLARIPRESSKTRDITGGLPRVAELFEARKPKDSRSSARSTGGSSSARTTRRSAGSSSCRARRARSRSSTSSPRASTSRCRRAITSRRAICSWTAIPCRTTSCACSGSRRSPPISSTRSRRSIGSRASASTTSTSR
jgi:DNA-directed RNA polymerase subunit beta'